MTGGPVQAEEARLLARLTDRHDWRRANIWATVLLRYLKRRGAVLFPEYVVIPPGSLYLRSGSGRPQAPSDGRHRTTDPHPTPPYPGGVGIWGTSSLLPPPTKTPGSKLVPGMTILEIGRMC